MMLIGLVLAYVVGHGVCLYNNDAKMKAKCKGKGWYEVIVLIVTQIWDNHKFWYKDSEVEDIVQGVAKDGAQVVSQAKVAGAQIVSDVVHEAHDVMKQAKEMVEEEDEDQTASHSKQTTKTSVTKPSKKSESKTTKTPSHKTETSKNGKTKSTTKKK